MATADQFRALLSGGNILQLPDKQWSVERVPSLQGHWLRVSVFLAAADGSTVQKNLRLLPANADENLRISFAGAASAASGNTPVYVLTTGARPHEHMAVSLDAENMLISSAAPPYTARKHRLDELVLRAGSKAAAAAYSSFLNEMWRNSENEDFWKCPEKSGVEFSTLDESIDTEMGGAAVLPTGNAEQAAQNWQSLLTLLKQKRSISHSNTIRYQIQYNHRYPRVVKAKDVKGCTFNIPIQYIIQAEDYERIRDEDRARVVNLKESMAWNPHSFQNTSLVYVIWAESGEHLTSAEEFDPSKVYDGIYRFVCFGHQHSLTARRELHAEQPDNEAFQQIE
ncbi:hypothetical protein CYMTET_16749 [Cymbomonas tetramitiformis]|uniref:Uncharacterized protein n=1 Tax=Cymbomonas tetramitiformis TaxID=36881 RepID=A0AAE0L7U9_9CHLO|nr:hypothetical protein CYMTET_16749 [Cymbomonas tetramitiformis]